MLLVIPFYGAVALNRAKDNRGVVHFLAQKARKHLRAHFIQSSKIYRAKNPQILGICYYIKRKDALWVNVKRSIRLDGNESSNANGPKLNTFLCGQALNDLAVVNGLARIRGIGSVE